MGTISPTPARSQLLVTLVRHGETALNAQRLLQGQTDIPLSEVGREQAEQLGKYKSNTVFTKAFSSDLCRAHETAQIILQYSKRHVPITVDKRLRERCFGEAEGKHATDLFNEATRQGLSVLDYTPKGGESSIDVCFRAGSFFKDLCELTDSMENPENEHALIVSHGGWMANLLRHLNSSRGIYFLKNFNESEGYRIPPNTGVTSFGITSLPIGSNERRVITFKSFNDASHLE